MNIEIYNSLIDSEYIIEYLSIEINYLSNRKIIIQFTNFNDYNKFCDLHKEYIDNYKYRFKNCLSLNLNTNIIKKFPKVNKIYIINKTCHENPINLNNLPFTLKELEIKSSKPFDISNLPYNLEILILHNTVYDLSKLPENLKILIINSNGYLTKSYNINSFVNLPIGITQICFRDKLYLSVDEMLNDLSIL